MKTIEWNNVEELPPADGMADCDNAEEVLEVVDNQLKKFDLEVIRLDLGCDTLCWRIEKRWKNRIIDNDGDRFLESNDGKWFWADMNDIEIGPFETIEEAREDAHQCGWSYDESISGGLYGGKPPRDIAKRNV